ncbi:MAG: hypothetical protein DRN11_01470 [Thermoplasmata archaeon]|nr:MAG: hypothetical protein DRN11_01470 [Thermoplasmata archaeon]
MIKRDRIIADLIFLLIIFLILHAFSSDLKNLFNFAEENVSLKPAKSFFWLMALLFGSFENWIFLIISYLIVGGIIYLIERRD